MATARQKRQQKLSWALRICMGFRTSMYFIPRDIAHVSVLRLYVDRTIEELRHELRNIS